MTTMLTCPVCDVPTNDGLMCRTDTARLSADLAALPALLRELQTTLTRQTKTGGDNVGTSTGKARPLPFDVQASDVGDVVTNTLSTWVRELDAGDTVGLADNPRALAHWMLVRIERIRSHIAAAEIADEISYCVRIIRHAIDRRPDKVYLGPCQTIVEGAPCKTQLYAPATAEAYDCPQCGQPVNVAQRRQELLALIADQVGTVGTCCQVLAMFGLEVKAHTIHNWTRARIDRDGITYVARLQPERLDADGKTALYRVGAVVTLVHESVKTKADRQQRRKSA
jgi:hypothetical protein